MPHHETDPKPDANHESGPHGRRGDEPPRDDETQADSRLAGEGGDGPRSNGRRLPLTEPGPTPSGASITEPEPGRAGAQGESPELVANGKSDPLADAIDRWDETRRLDPDPSPKSIGIENVAYLNELHRDIKKKKPSALPDGPPLAPTAAAGEERERTPPQEIDITRAHEALDAGAARRLTGPTRS